MIDDTFIDFKQLVADARSKINFESVGHILLSAEQNISMAIKNEPYLDEWKYTHGIPNKNEGEQFMKVFNENFKDKTQLTVKLCESFNYKIETYYVLFSYAKED